MSGRGDGRGDWSRIRVFRVREEEVGAECGQSEGRLGVHEQGAKCRVRVSRVWVGRVRLGREKASRMRVALEWVGRVRVDWVRVGMVRVALEWVGKVRVDWVRVGRVRVALE